MADFAPEAKYDALPDARAVTGPTAFLTVQEGCDKFCTFCVVPYTRGAEYSRPVVAILDEARRLADQGVREVTLLGQNVNAYNGLDLSGAPSSLARLAYALAEISGLDRIRYTTSHPRDMGEDLIAAHGDLRRPDALLAPAGAVGIGQGAEGHEPGPHRRELSAPDRAHPRRAAGHGALRRLHRRLPWRERCGFRSDARSGASSAVTPPPSRSNIPNAPARPASAMPMQIAEEVKTDRLARLNALLEQSTGGLQRRHRRPHPVPS